MEQSSIKNKVISNNNLPPRIPIWSTLLVILALDYWNAPMWLCGAIGCLFVLIWIGYFISMFKNTPIDIFKDDKKIIKSESEFAKRLKEKLNGTS